MWQRILKIFECLVPENVKNVSSVNSIIKIANSLPLLDIDVDVLSIEWKLLQIDSEARFNLYENQRIDEYWSQIDCGGLVRWFIKFLSQVN